MKKKVLFVCVHNSARSQMAEAFLKKIAPERFDVESAGLEPGELNPVAVQVMQEIGIDISTRKTQSVFDLFKQGKKFNYVITVCDESQSERCPIFPAVTEKVHWGFDDPSQFQGSEEQKLQKAREVRNQIQERIAQWIG